MQISVLCVYRHNNKAARVRGKKHKTRGRSQVKVRVNSFPHFFHSGSTISIHMNLLGHNQTLSESSQETDSGIVWFTLEACHQVGVCRRN